MAVFCVLASRVSPEFKGTVMLGMAHENTENDGCGMTGWRKSLETGEASSVEIKE